MYPFTYHRPANLADAARIFAEGADASFVSGGHTLLPTLKQRLASPSDMIDLWGLPELRGITFEGGILRIGGSMTHAEVSHSEIVRAHIPVLAGLAGSIGDRHVRHRGTIGGSVANNDPAADYPAAVLGLHATVVTDRRRFPALEYFTGLYETAREPGEIVTAVEFAIPLSCGYAKFRNPASRYAVAAVLVTRHRDGVTVAVTGAGASGVFRPLEFEAALEKNFHPTSLASLRIDPAGMLADPSASAEYRADLVRVLAGRAVAGQGLVQVFK